MAKSIVETHKKRGRGRPYTGGGDPFISARMPRALIKRLQVWAEENEITRAEAVRLLVEHGLDNPPKLRR
jgi:hypothetical protein